MKGSEDSNRGTVRQHANNSSLLSPQSLRKNSGSNQENVSNLDEKYRLEQISIENKRKDLIERRNQLESRKRKLSESKKSLNDERSIENTRISASIPSNSNSKLNLDAPPTLELPPSLNFPPSTIEKTSRSEVPDEIRSKNRADSESATSKIPQTQGYDEKDQSLEIERKKNELNLKKKSLEERKKRLEEEKNRSEGVKSDGGRDGNLQIRVPHIEIVEPPQLFTPPMDSWSNYDLKSNKNDDKPSENEAKNVETEENFQWMDLESQRIEMEEKERLIEMRRQLELKKEQAKERRKMLEEMKRKEEEEEEKNNKMQDEQLRFQMEVDALTSETLKIKETKRIESEKRQIEERKRALEELKKAEEMRMEIIELERIELEAAEEKSELRIHKFELENRERMSEEEERKEIREWKEKEIQVNREETITEAKRRELEAKKKALEEKKRDISGEELNGAIEEEKKLEESRKELEKKREMLDRKRRIFEESKRNAEANSRAKRNEILLEKGQLEAKEMNIDRELSKKLEHSGSSPAASLEEYLATVKVEEKLSVLSVEQQEALKSRSIVSPPPEKSKNTIHKSGFFGRAKRNSFFTVTAVDAGNSGSSVSKVLNSFEKLRDSNREKEEKKKKEEEEKKKNAEEKKRREKEKKQLSVKSPNQNRRKSYESPPASPNTRSPRGSVSSENPPEIEKITFSHLSECLKGDSKEKMKNMLRNEPNLVEETDENGGGTLLHLAVSLQKVEWVRFLLHDAFFDEDESGKSRKIDVGKRDKNGIDSLLLASQMYLDHMRIVPMALDKIEISLKILKEILAFHGVETSCSSPTNGNETLHNLCSESIQKLPPHCKDLFQSSLEVILKKKKGEINVLNGKGETILHLICEKGSTEILKFILNYFERLKGFSTHFSGGNSVYNSIKFNTLNLNRESAIVCALKNGHKDVLSLLVPNFRVDLTIPSEKISLIESRGDSLQALQIVKNMNEREKNGLSSDIWLRIFGFLSPVHIVHLGRVCRQFGRIYENENLWREKCEEEKIWRRGIVNSWKKIWMVHYLSFKKFIDGPFESLKGDSNQLSKIIKAQSLIRRWNAVNSYRKIVKMNSNRDKLIRELVDTERTYVEGLRIIVKLYFNPLRSQVNEKIITKQQTRSLFSDIEVILNTNAVLLSNLENRILNWNVREKIADIFIDMVESFKLYAHYISSFDLSLQTFKECRENPLFEEWIEPREKVKTLNSLLILPVQRMPRYIMLLSEILKNTREDHPDHADLKLAVEQVSLTTNLLNEKKRQADNNTKIREIEESIEPNPGHLGAPGRSLILEGEFVEVVKNQRIPIHIFLFSDLLILTRPPKKFKNSSSKHKMIKMEHLRHVNVTDANGEECGFTIEIGGNVVGASGTTLKSSDTLGDRTGTRVIVAPSISVKRFWMKEINRLLERVLSHQRRSRTEDELASEDSIKMASTLDPDAPAERRAFVYQMAFEALMREKNPSFSPSSPNSTIQTRSRRGTFSFGPSVLEMAQNEQDRAVLKGLTHPQKVFLSEMSTSEKNEKMNQWMNNGGIGNAEKEQLQGEQIKSLVAKLADETKSRMEWEKAAHQAYNAAKDAKMEDMDVIKMKMMLQSLQQQMVIHMESISSLESQVKFHQEEKIQLENRYEERVYFIEKEFKEKKEAISIDHDRQIRALKVANVTLEKKLEAIQRPPPSKSTGPAPPPRRSSYSPLPVSITNGDEDKKREASSIPPSPLRIPQTGMGQSKQR
eukprot:TRINITY_DN887_c0_g1_i1.p1 TRINITY_DN887_c0_g1~~TRINITY_DN887_c0_g1_i1.p1  ORF type:complete len:1736 (-),score=672.97 TRINITY_DN887_c0_g1_i1:47-5254(-)